MVEDIQDLLVLKDLTRQDRESRIKSGEEAKEVSVTMETTGKCGSLNKVFHTSTKQVNWYRQAD